MKIYHVLFLFFTFQLAMVLSVASQMPSKKVITEGLQTIAR